MKKIILLTLFISCCQIMSGQGSKDAYSPFSLELAIMPNHAFNESIQTYPYLSEEFRVTYNSNLLLNYHVTNRLIVQTGIQYKYLNLNINDHFAFKEYTLENSLVDANGLPLTPYYFDVNSSFGDFQLLAYVQTDRLEDGDDFEEGDEIKFDVFFKETISMLGIPLYVKYKIGNKKTRFSLKAGVAYHHIIKKKISDEFVTLFTDGATLVNDEVHRRLNISYPFIEKEFEQIKSGYLDTMLGLGVEQEVREHLYFIFEPMVTNAFTPLMDTEDVQTYHNSWALYVGIRYHL